MALAEREVRETTVQDPNVTQTTRRVENPAAEADHGKIVAVRVVWYIAGVLLTLLGLRFVLALLGANAGSGFVSFVYSVTYPFVAPFFGIFGYDFTAGQARFEAYTLLAMLVYALIAWGVAKLLLINRRTDTTA